MKDLKKQWCDICNEYVRLFIEKHELESKYYEDYWIANDPGTIICISDMYISMDDIRYDIDNDIPKEKFEEWYWESLRRHEYNIQYMNYPSFCKGAPDPIPAESLERIIKLRKKLENIKRELEKETADYNTNIEHF